MVPCPPLSSFQGDDNIAIRLALNRVQNLLHVAFLGASKRDLYDNESCLTEPA
jgi:hypothetical protein